MPSIKFSATSTATAATSITVALGGTPAVGDLVFVFLLVDNEIITHQPGWATEFTAAPNPWFRLDGVRAPDSSTLTGWYHTWNASDSGNSATFTFVPAQTLGIGDKDIPNTNAIASAVVLDGSLLTALLESSPYGSAQDLVASVNTSAMRKASNFLLTVVANNTATSGFQNSDGAASLITGAGLATPSGGMSMDVWGVSGAPAGYSTTISLLQGQGSLMTLNASVSDNQPQLYNSPFIEEAPMGMNALMARYRMNRYFTVLNNSGTFTAQRYQSTDQIAAATQVFVNNQPITTTDRTNLLNSGVGGEFRAVS